MEVKLALLKSLKVGKDVTISSVPFVIGRCRTANFIIAHVNVSRNHCQIILEENIWKICDNSSSGTFLNDALVGKGKSRVLKNGDIIRFGPMESQLFWSFYPLNSTNEDTEEYSLSDMTLFTPRVQLFAANSTEENQLEKNTSNINSKIEEVKLTGKPLNSAEFKVLKTNQLLQENSYNADKCKSQTTNCLRLPNAITENNIVIENNQPNNVDFNFECRGEKLEIEPEIIENKIDLVEKELENKLIKQEEEKQILLKKLEEMEKAQKILLDKLNENQNLFNKNCHEKKTEMEVEEEFSSLGNESNMETRKNMSTQELIKELEQVKNALNELEDKNSTLEGQLAAFKTENDQTNLLENFTDLMETELTCTICSELFVTAITLNCMHTFCKYCIDQWKKKQKNCPFCRKKIINETRLLVLDNYIDRMVQNLSTELKKRREEVISERLEISSKKSKSRKKR